MRTFAHYVGFDIENMPFERVYGRETIDIVMMQDIGIVKSTLTGYRLTRLPNTQRPLPQKTQEVQEEEEEEEEVDNMVARMDNLELQVRGY